MNVPSGARSATSFHVRVCPAIVGSPIVIAAGVVPVAEVTVAEPGTYVQPVGRTSARSTPFSAAAEDALLTVIEYVNG